MSAPDPEVVACLAVHATAPVMHCACCGICEDCDATLGVQETPDLCETCALAAEEDREPFAGSPFYCR